VRLLVVCSGNICRSPLAAALLRMRLDARWHVESAGTAAREGEPMAPETVTLAHRYGVLDVSHEARRLTPSLAEPADLILALDRAQRRRVAELAPRVVRRAFTLREFARLADGATRSRAVPSPSLAELLEAISEQRRLRIGEVGPEEDEVADPFGRPLEVHVEAGRIIDEAVRVIARNLNGVGTPVRSGSELPTAQGAPGRSSR
jgi:protein-tyrosine phosphatase